MERRDRTVADTDGRERGVEILSTGAISLIRGCDRPRFLNGAAFARKSAQAGRFYRASPV
jgi:hypothetical protein